MLGGGADRLCTPSTSAGPFRIFAVAGFQNRANDIVYCPPIIRQTTQNVEDSTAIVYFGGDVQDFPESMETNRDSRVYMKYNLENSAILLREAFPRSHIIVIRPVRMEFKTFSCFDNFVRGNNAGVPDHTPMNHALQHLEKLLQNLSHRLVSIPENEILDQAAQAEAAAAAVAAAAAAAALTLSTANAQVENNTAAHNAAKAAAAAAAAALLTNNSSATATTQSTANNGNGSTASTHNPSTNNNNNSNGNGNSNNSNDCQQDMDIDILQVQENITLSTDGAVIFPTATDVTNDHHLNEALIAASTDIDSKMDTTTTAAAETVTDTTPTDMDTTNAADTEVTAITTGNNSTSSNTNNTCNNLLLTPGGADDEHSQTNNLVADLTNSATSSTTSSTSSITAAATTTTTHMPATRMFTSSPPPLTPISSDFMPLSNNVNAMQQESSSESTQQPQKLREKQQQQSQEENGNPLWWRENLNLDKSKLILIGFSKGCVVLNQFIYEFHYLKTLTPDDSTMVRLLSRIKDMYWLDGGHGGQKNTWITSRSLLETLTRMAINVHVHLTPYQVQDDRRPWIRKEEKIFSDMLRRLGSSITRHLHYDNQTPNLMTHFEVLQAFCEHIHNATQQPHNNSEQTVTTGKQQQHNNDINSINRSTSPTSATTNDNSLNESEK